MAGGSERTPYGASQLHLTNGVAVHGDVFGLVVRARNIFSNMGAQLRTVAGGEVSGYTRLLTDSRNQARQRMWREATSRGANAVIAMRFDCNEIGDIMSEVATYGTAVTVAMARSPPRRQMPAHAEQDRLRSRQPAPIGDRQTQLSSVE